MASSSSSSLSWSYDVFLSFRGEDTRKTFVDHLYTALERRLIRTYKDDITLPRGESVGPALLKAIQESRHAVVIFSKNYADSSWCLDELVHIMKCRDENGMTVMPVFYDVDPSDVRYQNMKFGDAFAVQEMKNSSKAELWRKALVDASNISGWEPKNVANGHEAAVIQKIVDAISDELFSSNYSYINEELVGMTNRVKDFISSLELGTGGVRMVGIWGVGGGGKTTLATSVYMKIKDRFRGHCIVDNIREKTDLIKLQKKILNGVLKTHVRVQNVEEGEFMIFSSLSKSNVLIILDDVDDHKQLEALAGSHRWFGDGSRIIITTRNEHLLQKVDYVYPVMLLSQDEGNQLFKKHAYNDKKPLKNYLGLSLRVVSYADGLPLALKVLGSFLYDKDENEWLSTLDRLKDVPQSEILKKLKISYDGLETMEKELFLDIACFFRGEKKDDKMEIFEAFGMHPHIGIKVLIQKTLITIDSSGMFDMHGLVQEMGHYIVREEHPNNPEKHSRLCKYKEIRSMCRNTTMENDKSEGSETTDQPLIYLKMVPKRWLIVERGGTVALDFLSNDLQCIEWYCYPASQFPDSFEPTNLAVLKLVSGLQTELWKTRKRLRHLKVLRLMHMEELVSTPNFYDLPSLEKLTIFKCIKLKEIDQSLGYHKNLKHVCFVSCGHNIKYFPRIVRMKKLETLHIQCEYTNFYIPRIESDMENLVHLYLNGFSMLSFLSSVARHCPNLISLQVIEYNDPFLIVICSGKFSKFDSNGLSKFSMLVHLDLSNCSLTEKLPEFPSSLVIFKANSCCKLTEIGDVYRNCKWLCQVSIMTGGILTDGNNLLQSMLQGKAIENHSLVLLLEGLQIPRLFQAPLRDGTKYTLQLPRNWRNDFCGFLICAVLYNIPPTEYNTKITMKQVRGGSMDIDTQDGVDWEESVDDKRTWVAYVSFGSLRHNAAWLDETCNAVSFSMPAYGYREVCHGFGVSLIPRTSGSCPTDLSPPEYRSHFPERKFDFKPKFIISEYPKFEDDFTCTFQIPSPLYDQSWNF